MEDKDIKAAASLPNVYDDDDSVGWDYVDCEFVYNSIFFE